MTAAKFTCPECKEQGINTTFDRPTGLALHRKYKHGVKSGAQKEQDKRAAKMKKKGASNDAAKGEIVKAETTPEPAPKRTYIKRTPSSKVTGDASIAENILYFTVGRLTEICANAARSYGIPESEFTKRCSEFFYASQVRQ